MNDTAVNWLAGTGGVGTFLVFLRWVVTQWMAIRREEIESDKINAATVRADGTRMVEALLAQATSNAVLGGAIERSNAVLGGKLDQLSVQLDKIEWRERTPIENVADETSGRRRIQTPARGYRTPKQGDNND